MVKQGEVSSHPHFFRVILTEILENGALELPKNFVEEHGKRVSKSARLKVPTGAESQMELKRCNGRAWLHNGWQEFVEKYSIQCGYFLLFKYKGGSRFDVRIFDLSTSEIAYPVSSANTCNKNPGKWKLTQVKKEHSDDDDEDDDDDEEKVQIGRGMENANLDGQKVSGQRCSSAKNKSPGGAQVIKGRGDSDTNARRKALERAKAFQSPNPHFTVIMRPTSKSYMNVPAGPAKSYFSKGGENSVSLKVANGRAWYVKYVMGAPPRSRVRLCSGWAAFARQNHLQQGDVFVFELLNTTPITFRVNIFRITDDHVRAHKNDPLLITPNVASRALKRAESKCKAPHFMIRMTSYDISSKPNVHIPSAHSKRYFNKDQQGENVIILHGSYGKTWPVQLNYSIANKQMSFASGWKDFVSDNRLRARDVLLFEMIIGMPMAYKVTISPVANHA